MMLINDESAFCRKMTGSALKLLIAKVGAGQSRDELFGVVLNWSKQDKVGAVSKNKGILLIDHSSTNQSPNDEPGRIFKELLRNRFYTQNLLRECNFGQFGNCFFFAV